MSLSINYKELVIISFNHLHGKTCYAKLDRKYMNIFISNFHLNPVIAIKIISYVYVEQSQIIYQLPAVNLN